MAKIVLFSMVALQSLFRQRLRSFLSILGIVCGVLAVMAMLATGEGAKRQVLEELENLGLNNIYIEKSELSAAQHKAALERKSYGLTWFDVDRILALDCIVAHASGVLSVQGQHVDISAEYVPQLFYVDGNFLYNGGISVRKGRFIADRDIVNNNLVCVLGAKVAQKLGNRGSLGDTLRVGQQLYRIIGILADENSSSKSSKEISKENHDNIIFIPFTQMMRQGGSKSLQSRLDRIVVEVKGGIDVVSAAKTIHRTLQITHNNVSDYSMLVPLELLQQKLKTQKIFNLVLTVVAGISLFVGGIGIMNIMLANVSERKREIGLRRAVGANYTDIVLQFLIESTILTMLGGIIGLFLGFAAIFIIESMAGWPVKITVLSILLPFFLALFCGMIFGLNPALKAAKMEPIEALKSF